MKIKICIPHYCGLSKETIESVRNLKDKIDFDVIVTESTYIATGRNNSILGKASSNVKPILDKQYSHYLMVDSDIQFTPEQVIRLVNHKIPIVAGLYKSRCNDDGVAGYFSLVEGNCNKSLSMLYNGLEIVDWCGAGFLLIESEVLQNMDYPWFRHLYVPYTEIDGTNHCLCTGEDMGFCILAKKAGYKIVVDCDCKVNHIIDKNKAYNIQEHE
jgi:hypothetical protein